AQLLGGRDALLEGHVGVDPLPLDVVREADHGRLGHSVVGDERALHFRRAEAVSADVDDVVYAAGDPVVPVRVAAAAIAGEVTAREGGEVRLAEAVVIAEHAAHDPRPGPRDAEVPG